MSEIIAELGERALRRRSFLRRLGRNAFGVTVAIFGLRMFEAKLNAYPCALCSPNLPGCSQGCVEGGSICSWGWMTETCVCFECYECGFPYCYHNICSEQLYC